MHSASKEAIARILGYGGLNGTSNSVMSALQKYNLLEPEGDELKVSETAQDILIYPLESPERSSAVSSIAFLPSIFQELVQKYGLDLPNDIVITPNLLKMGFNPKAVPNVLRIFRDTIEFVKEEGASTKEESSEQDAPMETMSKNPVLQPLSQGPSKHTSVQDGQSRQFAGNESIPLAEAWGDKELRFQVTSSCEARVQLKGEITQEAIERLSAFIELSKLSFPRADSLKAQRLDSADFPENELELQEN